MRIVLYNQECLVGMKQIDGKSVDCILCDPPSFNIDNDDKTQKMNEE
jgi:hypothetical protein